MVRSCSTPGVGEVAGLARRGHGFCLGRRARGRAPTGRSWCGHPHRPRRCLCLAQRRRRSAALAVAADHQASSFGRPIISTGDLIRAAINGDATAQSGEMATMVARLRHASERGQLGEIGDVMALLQHRLGR